MHHDPLHVRYIAFVHSMCVLTYRRSSYNSWVPWLLSTSSTADEASREAAALASEALTMNALGAALVVLAVVVPFVVAYPRFRNRDGGRVVNISGDRYG